MQSRWDCTKIGSGTASAAQVHTTGEIRLSAIPANPSEIVTRGEERYDREIRGLVEEDHRGEMLAIDVDSGAYALGDDSLTALERLKAKAPDARAYLLRVGFPTAVRIGIGRKAVRP